MNNFHTITVVNKYKEPNHIYCGRGSALGNPFIMENGGENERAKVCKQYEEWFYEQVNEPMFLNFVDNYDVTLNPQMIMLIDIFKQSLKNDVNLGCFCAPKQCHCDTIKNFISNKIEESFK